MSHRREEKERLRAEREAADAKREADALRRRRLGILAGIVGVAVVAVVVIAVASGGGGDSGKKSAAEQGHQTSALLAGIPQSGTSLGKPGAPVVLTEFADLQCPFCREYDLNALPGVIKRYVRTGKLRLELRLLRFLGPDSDRGARAALAASGQNRLWNFVDAFYHEQGPENTGYADDGFLRGIAQAAGVKPSTVLDAVRRDAFEEQLKSAEAEAGGAGIHSTPSFMVARKGGRRHRVVVQDLTLKGVEQAIGSELGR